LVQIYIHFHRRTYSEIQPNVTLELRKKGKYLRACKKHSIISITRITANVTRANTTKDIIILIQFIKGPEVEEMAGNRIISMNTLAS
jgi:hypothetical protein